MRLDGEKQRKKQMPSWAFFFFFVKSIRLPGRVDPACPSFQPQLDAVFAQAHVVHVYMLPSHLEMFWKASFPFCFSFAARVVRKLYQDRLAAA